MRHGFFSQILALLLSGSLSLVAKDLGAPQQPPSRNLSVSVVRIDVTDQAADYVAPWNPGHVSGGVGSGFVIIAPNGQKRIMTNAHVVSNARFITISRERLSHPFTAHVEFIAHDCDLALLRVDDQGFFNGSKAV
jgi:S1-C subfamily serine protease